MIRRRRTRPADLDVAEVVLGVRLGSDDLGSIVTETERALASGVTSVVLRMTSFRYFDLTTLEQLTALVDRHPGRVRLEGTEDVASALVPDAAPAATDADVAGRAVAALNNVLVVAMVVDGRPLSAHQVELAFARVVASPQPLVALEFLGVAEITPGVTLAVAELSGDLAYRGRRLLCVNAEPQVAAALRTAGLSGAAVIRTTDPL